MLCEKKSLDEGTTFLVYSASQAKSVHTHRSAILTSWRLKIKRYREIHEVKRIIGLPHSLVRYLDPREVPVINFRKKRFYVSLQLCLLTDH